MKRIPTLEIVARELDISIMTASRLSRDLHRRSGKHLSQHDAVKILAAGKLRALGFTWPVACEALNEISSEIDYLLGGEDRQLWLVFVEHAKASYRVTALNQRYLMGLLDSVGIALVLPLHTVFDDARRQFNRALRAAA